MRLDKYLWAIRIYKTRTVATDAINSGKIVNISNNLSITPKPSYEVKVGDKFNIKQDKLIKTIEVKELLANRVSAKDVSKYYTDLTPAEEYERLRIEKITFFEKRDKGLGRPTKKERRDIDLFKNDSEL